jgi:hypothetical protein
MIRRIGRKNWKKRIGYHFRSLVETAVFRLKTIFGPKLKNRKLPNQRTEARLRCKILNYFTQFRVVNARINCNRVSVRGFPQGFDSRVVFGVVR